MKTKKNELGNTYGRLTVIEEQGKGWLCLCLCGNEKVVKGTNLRNGSTISCGCWQKDNPPGFKGGKANFGSVAYWSERIARINKTGNAINITPEQLVVIAREHNLKCDLCGKRPKNRNLCLDHCHKTGKFRGFLCNNCNRGLGLLGDNIRGLSKACQYLKRCEDETVSEDYEVEEEE